MIMRAITLVALSLLASSVSAAQSTRRSGGGAGGVGAGGMAPRPPGSRPTLPPSRSPFFEDVGTVERERVSLSFPPPRLMSRNTSDTVGFYAWRVTIPAPDPFSMVLIADTAVRTTSLKEIARASSLRLCPDGMSIGMRECRRSIAARIDVRRGSIVAVVTDTAIIARLRSSRPLYYVRSSIAPRGRVDEVEVLWRFMDWQ